MTTPGDALFEAANIGDFEALRQLARAQDAPDINTITRGKAVRGPGGDNLLRMALTLTLTLIGGDNLLRMAARNGNGKLVQILTEELGADVNLVAERATAMSIAAQTGHLEVVRMLADRSADIHQGEPICMAAMAGRAEI